MFDEELPLDTELIRWYIHRKATQNLSTERWSEYSCEISSRLSNNLQETCSFMETCSDEELNWLCEELGDLVEEFQEEPGEGEFIEFLKELGNNHPKSGILEELELIIESQKEIAGWENDEE